MAWLLQAEINPLANWSAKDTKDILESNAEIIARYSQLPPDHPDYVEESGFPGGLPARAPAFVRKVLIGEWHEPLPDAVTQTVINDRVRSIIEAVDPGTHQFFPTVLVLQSGEEVAGWWNWRICHRADALTFDKCQGVWKKYPSKDELSNRYKYDFIFDSSTNLFVSRDTIAGKSAWYDTRLERFFLGEELGRQLIDDDIRGLCLPTDELGRSMHVKEV